MFKKIMAIVLVVALTATISIAGTMAYLQDDDSDVNVMTLGNVNIEQHEYQRVTNEDGTYKTDTIDNQNSYVLEAFEQGKPLLPSAVVVSSTPWDSTTVRMSQVGSHGGMQTFLPVTNAQDKFVTVENTGKTDAYIRTIVAIEVGTAEPSLISFSNHLTWKDNEHGVVTIDGNNYYLHEFAYEGGASLGGVHNGFLPAGEISYPNLSQVYIKPEATNEDMVKLDGNGNGTLDILVLSQAVQTAGFENAQTALDTAFGAVTAENAAEWFKGMGNPELFNYEGVAYITVGNTAEVSSTGGDTLYRGILSDGKSTVTTVKVGEGITRLNNRALCKAPTITSVELPDSLTYIDESVFQQSGITSIEIPENVTYIGKMALGACDSLETITINAKNVTIADYVARDCANLKEVYINSDSVTFESGSMYFTNKQSGDASGITFYVKDRAMADTLFNAFSTSHSYGLLIKNVDGTVYYNTLK